MSPNTSDASSSRTDLSGIRILSTGAALPKTILNNHDLESMMDTSNEWIIKRTGIRERHVHKDELGESTASMAIEALGNALREASLRPTDLDLIVVATMTPVMPTPSTSCILAEKIGADPIPALDVNAA